MIRNEALLQLREAYIEILKKSKLYQNNREADECYRSYVEVKEK